MIQDDLLNLPTLVTLRSHRPRPYCQSPDARVLRKLHKRSALLRYSPIAAYTRILIGARSPLLLTESANVVAACACRGYQVMQFPDWELADSLKEFVEIVDPYFNGNVVILTKSSLLDWKSYDFALRVRFATMMTRIAFFRPGSSGPRSVRKALNCSVLPSWGYEDTAIAVLNLALPQLHRTEKLLRRLASFLANPRPTRRNLAKRAIGEILKPGGYDLRLFRRLLREERAVIAHDQMAKAVECGLCA